MSINVECRAGRRGAVSRCLIALLSASAIIAQGGYAALAQATVNPHGPYQGYASHVRTSTAHFLHNPTTKHTLVDAGIGAAGGALVGGISHGGLFKGAMVGAGTGAGIGLLRSSRTMQRHRFVKDAGTVGLAGLGLWMASRRGHIL